MNSASSQVGDPDVTHIPKWPAEDIEGFVDVTRLCQQCLAIFDSIQHGNAFGIQHHTGRDGCRCLLSRSRIPPRGRGGGVSWVDVVDRERRHPAL